MKLPLPLALSSTCRNTKMTRFIPISLLVYVAALFLFASLGAPDKTEGDTFVKNMIFQISNISPESTPLSAQIEARKNLACRLITERIHQIRTSPMPPAPYTMDVLSQKAESNMHKEHLAIVRSYHHAVVDELQNLLSAVAAAMGAVNQGPLADARKIAVSYYLPHFIHESEYRQALNGFIGPTNMPQLSSVVEWAEFRSYQNEHRSDMVRTETQPSHTYANSAYYYHWTDAGRPAHDHVGSSGGKMIGSDSGNGNRQHDQSYYTIMKH
ncbi:hypothetical protein SeMB42_g00669 [Synchytrium endobioticum]|uniref:Uncharacterized protein n=1 Tax=Synchytrium endobioticum TaxID=286115 RepID=A0A507DQU8_9FUNG|nr:hypothetical protein SeLEV6574_g00828 [Synchytrium endobioticum]TPX53605.1 hypothetical protein SeMB42_g00669 [Synchytrium endobioticum]